MQSLTKLVDVLNLNAEASCLSSKRWLAALEGGRKSELYQMLECYIDNNCKISLGIVGSTLIEVKTFNNECIDLINQNPHIFEVILRPYIHSLSILWSDNTFKYNFDLGTSIIKSTFDNVIDWYLPPEFALRNSQVYNLYKSGVKGTFINPKRLKENLKKSMPTGMFQLHSIQNVKIDCISFTEHFDSYYLEELQLFESSISFNSDIVFGWRDAESSFFLPSSVEREKHFIKQSSQKFNRIFLSEFIASSNPKPPQKFKAYPQNSLLPWLGDFRLYWYMAEIKGLEKVFSKLAPLKQLLFLNLLNSDILSSIEKNDVRVPLKKDQESNKTDDFIIKRKERNLDAEELLYLIQHKDVAEIEEYIQKSTRSFFKKIKARMSILHLLNSTKL